METIENITECQNIRNINIYCENVFNLNPVCQLPNLESFSCDHFLLDHQDPRTFRILARFINRNMDEHIYVNRQNVHDSAIQLSLIKSVENILKDPVVKYDPDKIVQSGLSHKTVSLIMEYCDDTTVHSRLQITFSELLAYVWERIEKHANKEELMKILSQQMSDAECMCFIGRFNRLLNVLVGFYDDVSINVSNSSRISAIIINTGKNINPYSAEQHRIIAQKSLEEAGYTIEEVQEWLNAIE